MAQRRSGSRLSIFRRRGVLLGGLVAFYCLRLLMNINMNTNTTKNHNNHHSSTTGSRATHLWTQRAHDDDTNNPQKQQQKMVDTFGSTEAAAKGGCTGDIRQPQKRQPSNASNTTSSSSDKPNKFAYAFMVAGCTEVSCQYYVLNAVVASTVLRYHGSMSDIIFGVRMESSSTTNDDDDEDQQQQQHKQQQQKQRRLSCQQEEWLASAGIRLVYLPTVSTDNFGTASLEMFRILEMTEYDRVYYLDSDSIPLCNIDYHMDLSYYNNNNNKNNNHDNNAKNNNNNTTQHSSFLQDFVAFQGTREPLNAGRFIVTPREGLFEQVMNVIHRHRQRSSDFSPIEGWGHVFDADNPDDRWVGTDGSGLLWNFHGFQIDQGLLYYWLKYEVLNWTCVLYNGDLQQWRQVNDKEEGEENDNENGRINKIPVSENRFIVHSDTIKWRKIEADVLSSTRDNEQPSSCGRQLLYGRDQFENQEDLGGINVDVYHYFGFEKPWKKAIRAEDIPVDYTTSSSSSWTGRDVWLYWLGVANRTLELELPSVLDSSFRSPYRFDWKSDRNMLLQPEMDIPKPTPAGFWNKAQG